MDLEPVSLTRDLLQFDSPTGREGAVVAFMAHLLSTLGWTVVAQPVSPGRDNLYATRTPPSVVLSTHLDTVPGGPPVSEDADTLWGRGSVDAKGIAACMTVAAERMVRGGRDGIGLLFLVGEEDGSDGALAAKHLEPKGQYLINGEPTENQLAIGQKGALRVSLRAEGQSAHSGYPELGRSAIDLLLAALVALRQVDLPTDPVLGATTLNVGRIQGGVAPNVIPPHATAECLIRTVGPTTALQGRIREALTPSGVDVSFPLDIPPVRSAPLPDWPTTTVSYTSDWPLLSAWGEGYQIGPGTIRVAHTDDEHIAKDDLHAGVEAYQRLLDQLLRRSVT